MTNEERLSEIRGQTLDTIESNEKWFKVSLGFCGVAEIAGLIAVFLIIDWDNPTHQLIFAATMLVWINLALWVWTLGIRSRVGEQRILKAIELLLETQTQKED